MRSQAVVRQVTRLSESAMIGLKLANGLPPSSDFHGPHERGRLPTPEERAEIDWWIAGDIAAPTAYMALRRTYAFPEMRDCLEVVGIEGNLTGVGRLVKIAAAIAEDENRRLVAHIPLNNPAMEHFAFLLGMKPETRCWGLELDG